LLYYNPEGASLAAVLNRYRTVVLLGGTETYTFFMKRNLIDEMYLTVEPVDFREGLRLFDSPEDISKWFYLEWTEPLGDQGTELRHYLRKMARARV
jgi:dihydrofolate reductase